MKTNVTYLNTEYYVNEEKQTVVCKLQFMIDLDKIPNIETYINFEPIQEYLANFDHLIADESEDREEAGVVIFTVRGKSTASGDDAFNVKLGKHLALTRAQANAFEVAQAFYTDLYDIVVENTVYALEPLRIGSITAWVNAQNHIDDLLIPYTPQDAADTPEPDND